MLIVFLVCYHPQVGIAYYTRWWGWCRPIQVWWSHNVSYRVSTGSVSNPHQLSPSAFISDRKCRDIDRIESKDCIFCSGWSKSKLLLKSAFVSYFAHLYHKIYTQWQSSFWHMNDAFSGKALFLKTRPLAGCEGRLNERTGWTYHWGLALLNFAV